MVDGGRVWSPKRQSLGITKYYVVVHCALSSAAGIISVPGPLIKHNAVHIRPRFWPSFWPSFLSPPLQQLPYRKLETEALSFVTSGATGM